MFPFLLNRSNCSGGIVESSLRYVTALMSIQRGLKIECPYEGCGSEFPTDRSLRVHIRGHQASSPFGCEYAGCTAVFATVSERSAHKATVHAEKRNEGKVVVESNGAKKRDKSSDSRTGVGDSVFADSIISNESHSAPDSNVVDDLFESDDIREIADNSAYFVSQVRNIQVCSSLFCFSF